MNEDKKKAPGFLKRRTATDDAVTEGDVEIVDGDERPALMEFLACSRWGDGKARKTGSVTVFVDQGRLKAALNDRDQGLVLFVAAEAFTGLLDALEVALLKEDADWRRAAVVRRENRR